MTFETVVFHLLQVFVGGFSPIVELKPFLNNTMVVLWHQIDSYLDYFYRNLYRYGARSSEAQPLTNITTVIMVSEINGYEWAHRVWLLQPAVYEYY